MEFPAPPESVYTPIECPDFIETDLEEIPFGCPIPEVINEFGPENTGSDPAAVDSGESGAPVNEFGPDSPPTDPLSDEGRP